MAAGPRSGRRGGWRAVAARGLQGGIDTAAEFSGLLAQVAARRFDVGSSSITTNPRRGASAVIGSAMTAHAAGSSMSK